MNESKYLLIFFSRPFRASFWTHALGSPFSTRRVIAHKNIRFSSLFAAGDVSRGGHVHPLETSAAAKSEEKRMFSQVKRRLMTNKINNNFKKNNVPNNDNNNNLFEFTYQLETPMLIKVINKLLRFVDIDECSTRDSLPCDANADCINTFGTYNCTCRIGYSGNGTTCKGQYTAFTRLNAAQKNRLLSNSRTLSLVACVAGAWK